LEWRLFLFPEATATIRNATAYEKLEQFNAKFPNDMKKSILEYAIQGKLVEQRAEEGTGEELYRQIQAGVYVIATIFICWANIKAANASKEQLREMQKQFAETNRPIIELEFHYSRNQRSCLG